MKSAPWIASTRARTCWSSIRTSASTAASANPSARPNAILPDTEKGLEKWLELNRSLSVDWPNITRKGEAPADADEFKDEKDKFEKYFSDKPGGALDFTLASLLLYLLQ